jgi:16S rRNA (guanine527-N7)-methyltransferase
MNFHLRSAVTLVIGCHDVNVQFDAELARVLPRDIPHRQLLVRKAAQHLECIAQVNEHMNLTRLTDAREAAIKHVYDCVAPWSYFQNSRRILDAGTGAGFPGIPLSLVLPEARFTLSESIQKKARFVETVVEALELPNVQVTHDRAEQIATIQPIDTITARAVAPIGRILELFRKPLVRGARLILYKGPDVDTELAEAARHRATVRLLCRYELPEGLGTRSLLEVTASTVERASSRKRAAANPQ